MATTSQQSSQTMLMLAGFYNLPIDIIRCVLQNLNCQGISRLDSATCNHAHRHNSWLPLLRGFSITFDRFLGTCAELNWVLSRGIVLIRASTTSSFLVANLAGSSATSLLNVQSLQVQVEALDLLEVDAWYAALCVVWSRVVVSDINVTVCEPAPIDKFWRSLPCSKVSELSVYSSSVLPHVLLRSCWGQLNHLTVSLGTLPLADLVQFINLQRDTLQHLFIVDNRTSPPKQRNALCNSDVVVESMQWMELQTFSVAGNRISSDSVNALLCMMLPRALALTSLIIEVYALSVDSVAALLKHHLWRPRSTVLTLSISQIDATSNASKLAAFQALSARTSEWITDNPPRTNWDLRRNSAWNELIPFMPMEQQRISRTHTHGSLFVQNIYPEECFVGIERLTIETNPTNLKLVPWKSIWSSPALEYVSLVVSSIFGSTAAADAAFLFPDSVAHIESHELQVGATASVVADVTVDITFWIPPRNHERILSGLSTLFANRLRNINLDGVRVSGMEVVHFLCACRNLHSVKIASIDVFDASRAMLSSNLSSEPQQQCRQPLPRWRRIELGLLFPSPVALAPDDVLHSVADVVCDTLRSIFLVWKSHCSAFRSSNPVNMRVTFELQRVQENQRLRVADDYLKGVQQLCVEKLADLRSILCSVAR